MCFWSRRTRYNWRSNSWDSLDWRQTLVRSVSPVWWWALPTALVEWLCIPSLRENSNYNRQLKNNMNTMFLCHFPQISDSMLSYSCAIQIWLHFRRCRNRRPPCCFSCWLVRGFPCSHIVALQFCTLAVCGFGFFSQLSTHKVCRIWAPYLPT